MATEQAFNSSRNPLVPRSFAGRLGALVLVRLPADWVRNLSACLFCLNLVVGGFVIGAWSGYQANPGKVLTNEIKKIQAERESVFKETSERKRGDDSF